MRPLLTAYLVATFAFAADHHIDCAKEPSLDAVNVLQLHGGDRLLLRAGCRWSGTLSPRGSGTKDEPIVLGRYGEGAPPAIDGKGAEAAVLLHNQEYWEISGLEITNQAASEGLRRGVLIRSENFGGTLHHIYLRDLDIHDVKGKLGADMVSKCTGGIGFEVVTKSKPGRFDDVLIEKNRIRSSDSMGIYINTDAGPHPRDPHWEELRHTRIVVRGNTLDDIGKNAMCIRASLHPVIERNIIRGAAARLHGNAIYVFGCKDAVMQYNEVSGTKYPGLEGAAFDSDYNSEGTVIQYNYSHNNGGGLADICNNPKSKPPRGFNDGTIIRYNVSRDELARVIAFDGPATNTQIYNNTLYVAKGTSPHIIEFDIFGEDPGYPDGVWIRNNVIVNEGSGTYLYGKATNYHFEGNCFDGSRVETEPEDAKKIVGSVAFENAGKGREGLASVGGYRLAGGSACAGTGVTIEHNGAQDIAGNMLPAGPPDRGALQSPKFRLVDGLEWAKPQGIRLKADLYIPEGDGPFPAAVLLHGGGFTDRNRGQLKRQAAYLASLGVLGFAPEYRVAGEAPFPAAVYDAKAAVRWLRAHAAEYKIDPNRIFAIGSSAGGHLASMLGLTGGNQRYDRDGCCEVFSSRVTAVVAFNPALDLTAMSHRESLVTRFLGGSCVSKPEMCREASPVFHVDSHAVPFLILHGTADETVPYAQAVAMTEKLKGAGAKVKLFTATGAPHTFWSQPQWYEAWEKEMREFLRPWLNDPHIGSR